MLLVVLISLLIVMFLLMSGVKWCVIFLNGIDFMFLIWNVFGVRCCDSSFCNCGVCGVICMVMFGFVFGVLIWGRELSGLLLMCVCVCVVFVVVMVSSIIYLLSLDFIVFFCRFCFLFFL